MIQVCRTCQGAGLMDYRLPWTLECKWRFGEFSSRYGPMLVGGSRTCRECGGQGMVGQDDALQAEVDRLHQCMRTIGLQLYMHTGSPEEIANRLQSISDSHHERLKEAREQTEFFRNDWNDALGEVDVLAKRVAELEDNLRVGREVATTRAESAQKVQNTLASKLVEARTEIMELTKKLHEARS